MLIVGGNPIEYFEFNNLNTQWFNRVPFNRTKRYRLSQSQKTIEKKLNYFFI